MKKIHLFIFLIVSISAFSQRKNNIANEYSHFQLTCKKDTIDFVVADTSLNIKKPVLLFCQGSLPVPLFIDFPNEGIFPVALNNFDLDEMEKYYHVVVISMPKTPVIVGLDHLNKMYNYVMDTTDENSFSPEFLQADYLSNYVVRANCVLEFLRKQKWVESNQLVIAGHSQGAQIALEIAARNKNVTQLGLFGFNPLGRTDQYLRMARKRAESGEISWQEADSIQTNTLNDYSSYFDPVKQKQKSYAKSWASFSLSHVNTIVSLKIPVYIAYGSNDINGDFCDLLPLYFIERNKTNYKVIRYPNVEHNFFPSMENGQLDYQNGLWPKVMNEFIKWTKNTANPK